MADKGKQEAKVEQKTEKTKETVDLGLTPELKAKLAALASGDQLSPMDLVALSEAVEKGKAALRAKEDKKREAATAEVKQAAMLSYDEIAKNFVGITEVRIAITVNDKGEKEVFLSAKRGTESVLSIGNKPGKSTGPDGIITKGKYAGMTKAQRRAARKAEKAPNAEGTATQQ